MSPTICRENGFRFFFFSREESRLHVHVHCADGEAKFQLEPQIELAQNYGLRDRQIRAAEALFVPFAQFPRFKDAPIAKLTHVERPQPHHLYWPDLDLDLAVESIRHPEKFPLVSRVSA